MSTAVAVCSTTPRRAAQAVINTPGGGNSRNVRRPDLIPGADPFINNADGVLFLNPAAFATPLPGTFGNLERGSLHGPGFSQIDLVLAKHFPFGGGRNFEFGPRSSTSSIGPTSRTRWQRSPTPCRRRRHPRRTRCNRARLYGRRGQHLRRDHEHGRPNMGLGTSRQVQFALRVNF